MPKPKNVHLTERYTQEWVDKLVYAGISESLFNLHPFEIGRHHVLLLGLFDSVLTEKPYPIRAIIAPGSQALVSTRGGKRVVEALKKLEFYVVVDVTRTCRYAVCGYRGPRRHPLRDRSPLRGQRKLDYGAEQGDPAAG